MTQQTYNPAGVDLAVAALAQIEMHPETWDQRHWRCETGMCLAGTMVDLSPEVTWGSDRPGSKDYDRVSNGAYTDDWAIALIGIEDSETCECCALVPLFCANNSIEDLRVGVKALCNGGSVHEAIECDRAERAK